MVAVANIRMIDFATVSVSIQSSEDRLPMLMRAERDAADYICYELKSKTLV